MPQAEGIDLRGKVAVVTGASGGIGRVFAQSLARAGALVVVTGRSITRLNETLDLLQAESAKAVAIAFDVTNEEAVKNGIRQAEETLGPIDLLVNNAGDGGPVPSAAYGTSIRHNGGELSKSMSAAHFFAHAPYCPA